MCEQQVTAIDIVPAMIEAAERAAQEARVGNTTVHVMDAEALEFEDRSFDVVICAFGLGFTTRVAPAISAGAMVSAKAANGRLASSTTPSTPVCPTVAPRNAALTWMVG